ncbi:putative fimbrial protein [Yersinia intermedia]|uniref:Putative fimbrial protein n=1 Tax=Yersinia intermedia TaxID=631 RepID=A0A0H5LVS3_YERIN|nr:fimbrial protein [Yersinia intermedia]CRY55254.1 putative fimbrial protein [Yersinia intermedia]
MKKKLIVTSLLAATVFASAANAATFNITGSIASTPCVATAANADIKMPLINKANLETTAGGFAAGSITELKINLANCPNINQTATVTFTGTADTEDNKALKLTGVEGVALALFEENGTSQIDINRAARGQSLTGTPTKVLKYKAKYVTTSKTFKEGNATATLNFDVAYN